jgi:hypothetical protein
MFAEEGSVFAACFALAHGLKTILTLGRAVTLTCCNIKGLAWGVWLRRVSLEASPSIQDNVRRLFLLSAISGHLTLSFFGLLSAICTFQLSIALSV